MTTTLNSGSSVGTTDVRRVAAEYRDKGIAIARIRPGEKRPTGVGWTKRSAEPGEFGPGDSIGLMTGSPSDGGTPGRHLVCLDIDDPAALPLAEKYLPPTRAVEGHPAKRGGHRYYFVTDVPAWACSKAKAAVAAARQAGREPGPFLKHFNHAETGKGVFDFMGTGGQVVCPPSLRADGTRREWEPGCDISGAAVVRFDDLWAATLKLGEAAGAKIPQVGPESPDVAGDEEPGADEGATPAGPAPGAAEPHPPLPPQRQEPAGRVEDIPMDERTRRCRKYLQSVDLPRSGHGGHDATWRAARIVVRDFAIDDRGRALALLREFNTWTKASGEEPWDEAQLAHKVDDALSAPPDPQWPRGGKLLAGDDPRSWDDPARLAEGFLDERVIRFVKDTTFEYTGGAYQVVSGEWLSARVREYIERAAGRECRRRRSEQDTRRVELEARLNAPVPGADAPNGSQAAHRAVRAEVGAELERLNRCPRPVPQKVTQAMVANTIDATRVRAQLPDRTELDSWLGDRSDPGVLAVENGLLDPVGRTLQPHTPDWFSTARLPVAYDPDAPAPAKWLALLGELMEGDAELVAIIQEVFGACLDRGLTLKFFAALVGRGDNGKSVVLAVLRFLLGAENCSSVNLDELGPNRFAAFGLFGKLANVVGDQGAFESADEGRLKSFTGGDAVKFEQKGKDTFFAVNRAKLVFACNTMPTFSDKSDAVWNRLVPVPFGFTVPRERKNPALLTAAHWEGELPGILNWALDGLARLRLRGEFTRSAKCDALQRRTRLDSNPARQFLTEEWEYTGNGEDEVTVGDLYKAYRAWCESSGFTRPLTKNKFSGEVRSAFPGLPDSKVNWVKELAKSSRCWVGLRRADVTDVTEPAAAA